jgi:RNA polymerase sigma factor for flagellar operon FliA
MTTENVRGTTTSITDQAARQAAIEQYLPLVRYVMRRLPVQLGELESGDLLNYGVIGLIEAWDRFDPERGLTFEAYAVARIRGALMDALRKHDVLSRSSRRKARMIEAKRTELTQDLGREPSRAELAEALAVTPAELQRMINEVSVSVVSMSSLTPSNADGEEYSGSPAENIADADAHTFPFALEKSEQIAALAQAVKELPERQQLLLTLYYKEKLSMAEIAQVLDISGTRVGQIHAQALMRLRRALTADEAPTAPAPVRIEAARRARRLAA